MKKHDLVMSCHKLDNQKTALIIGAKRPLHHDLDNQEMAVTQKDHKLTMIFM